MIQGTQGQITKSIIPQSRKSLNIDELAIVDKVGLAAISAAGLDPLAPIWELFFPEGDPEFSGAQIEQMTTVFESVLANHDGATWSGKYQAYALLLGMYVNDPNDLKLSDLITETTVLASEIAVVGGYPGIGLYLSTVGLALMALSYEYDQADESRKAGAKRNIGESAFQALQTLTDLQAQMINSVGYNEAANFQSYCLFEGNQSTAWSSWIGEVYIESVRLLIQKVQTCAPDLLDSIPRPQVILSFPAYSSTNPTQIWSEFSMSGGGWIGLYFVPSAFYNSINSFPLGDIAVNGGSDASNPSFSIPDNIPMLSAYPQPPGGASSFVTAASGQLTFTQAPSGDTVSIWNLVPIVENNITYYGFGSYAVAGSDQPDVSRVFTVNQNCLSNSGNPQTIWSIFYGDNVFQIELDPSFQNDSILNCPAGGTEDTVNTNIVQALCGHPAMSSQVYRYYNTSSGAHCFTVDPLFQLNGFGLETPTFYLVPWSPNTVPFYIWMKPDTGLFFYTTDPKGESAPEMGYQAGGVLGHISTVQTGNTVPLYRWVKGSNADHFYTTDPNGEGAAGSGFSLEGIVGYVMLSPIN